MNLYHAANGLNFVGLILLLAYFVPVWRGRTSANKMTGVVGMVVVFASSIVLLALRFRS